MPNQHVAPDVNLLPHAKHGDLFESHASLLKKRLYVQKEQAGHPLLEGMRARGVAFTRDGDIALIWNEADRLRASLHVEAQRSF